MSYISPDQLSAILRKVKDYINSSGGSGGSGGDSDLSDITLRLQSLEAVTACSHQLVSFDELNEGAYLSKTASHGVRFVGTSARKYAISISMSHGIAGVVELVVGTVKTTDEGATLKSATQADYNKRPNICLAYRHRVISALYGDKTNAPAGLSKWQVIELADVTGFLNGFASGGSGSAFDASAIPASEINTLLSSCFS